jgi:hypothetical protein
MKLLFSEAEPDYSRYHYPYVVLAVPEPGETPADLFGAGFLPASPGLDRFTLARQLRVPLAGFKESSENRRILRKGAGLGATLTPRSEFDYSPSRRAGWLAFAAERFGEGVMPAERLDALMHSPAVTHLLVFRETGKEEAGTVLMYLEPPRMAFYYYAFYDLARFHDNLGLFMMTTAVRCFASAGYRHLYLGTCYSERARYKTQFAGVECFNGVTWTGDAEQLKHLVRRDQRHDLLRDPASLEAHGGWDKALQTTPFHHHAR